MNEPQVDERVQRWADEAWPLRFKRHLFSARCWNVQRCSVIYDNHEQGTTDPYAVETVFRSAGEPPSPDWKDDWRGNYVIFPGYHGGNAFPKEPVKLDWTALDGSAHLATVDLDALFKDRLVLHNVEREDIPVGWLAAKTDDPVVVDILLEVNDRTVNVYCKAHVTTNEEQIPGNPRSHHRRDLILAWTHIY